MKKLGILIILMSVLSCDNDEPFECIDIPCPRPNINDVIELTLSFENAEPGDKIGLVRINRSDKSVIDTVIVQLPPNKQVSIGDRGTVGFTEVTFGDVFEEATLDFSVILDNKLVAEVSNIEIERFLTQDECGCADYQISMLELNRQILEVNAKQYKLNILIN